MCQKRTTSSELSQGVSWPLAPICAQYNHASKTGFEELTVLELHQDVISARKHLNALDLGEFLGRGSTASGCHPSRKLDRPHCHKQLQSDLVIFDVACSLSSFVRPVQDMALMFMPRSRPNLCIRCCRADGTMTTTRTHPAHTERRGISQTRRRHDISVQPSGYLLSGKQLHC